MTAQELKTKSKGEVFDFIRKGLAFNDRISSQLRHVDQDEFKKEHKRFEMSGYEDKTGESTMHNQSILNHFADLGIYNYTSYLFLDFYKGSPTLYLKYFNGDSNLEYELGGQGTVEIIYFIFEKTIFSKMTVRRRN